MRIGRKITASVLVRVAIIIDTITKSKFGVNGLPTPPHHGLAPKGSQDSNSRQDLEAQIDPSVVRGGVLLTG